MWQEYFNVKTIDEALDILADQGERARIVAGATDLILEMERGVRTGIDTLIDITRIPGLNRITLDENEIIHIGPMVTHNHCVASKLIVERAFPLALAAWQVGAPQIRNRGTVAGNLITASPANDTISPLMALGARVTLASKQGERCISLEDFYTGVRKTVMRPDEMLVDIAFPVMQNNQRGTFMKLGLRQAQAISLVNVAMILKFNEDVKDGIDQTPITQAMITLGAVAPTIIHAKQAESFLAGKILDETIISHAAELAMQAAKPIDDLRSPADYRAEMVRVCTSRGLFALKQNEERAVFPVEPILLWGHKGNCVTPPLDKTSRHNGNAAGISTRINGQDFNFNQGADKTLLRLIREEAQMTGTKEGCAEGECGACTVFMDGLAVMSCLVPAPRAHQADIVTIEGIADEEKLHPVQQAFIDEGAVQCGYCTPGFIMSAVKLLEENPNPSREQIKQAITGNLCRCTGYYAIVSAIERAAQNEVTDVKIHAL
ncbi:MAG: 2Fe-2S iron-sulfur cluster binding domain-containing protein [Chloroflexi bacterium]|nr:2Fe-2S iron-sulfur cluster binding domain-containing protein [Chloroflexota bacterium]